MENCRNTPAIIYLHNELEDNRKKGLKRCGKSCRLRWFNYLRAGLKRGNITPQEEQLIVSLHSTLGNRWAMIASHLQGRTDNEIKNYWTSHLRRKLYRFMRKSPESNDVVPVIVNLLPPSKPKTKCGRTSRRAMKKTKTLINSDINSNPQTKKPESVVGGVDHTVSFEAETTSGNVCNNELGINVDDGDLCFDDVMDSCNLWLDGEDNGVLSCSELEAEILGGKDSERERGFGRENSSFSKDTEPDRGFMRQGSLGSELDCVLDNSLGDDRFDTCPLDAVHDDLFEWEGVWAVWQDCLNLWDEPEASLAQ